MIEKLLDDGAGVTLFTRPRRFGKTLNMSMLNYFFNLKKKEETLRLSLMQVVETPWVVKRPHLPCILSQKI